MTTEIKGIIMDKWEEEKEELENYILFGVDDLCVLADRTFNKAKNIYGSDERGLARAAELVAIRAFRASMKAWADGDYNSDILVKEIQALSQEERN